MNAETLPLNLKIESSKEVSMAGATSLLDKFLHNGVAIHAANNTISAQLHRLHQGLREEKKRAKNAGLPESVDNSDSKLSNQINTWQATREGGGSNDWVKDAVES